MLNVQQNPSSVAISVNKSLEFFTSFLHLTSVIFVPTDPVKLFSEVSRLNLDTRLVLKFLLRGLVPAIGQIVTAAKGISQIFMNFSEKETITGADFHFTYDR